MIFYLFKIRKSIFEPRFAVVKEGSMALESIKEGDIVNMRYYYKEMSVPAESKDTKIKYITKDSTSGFKDHYIIGLDIFWKKPICSFLDKMLMQGYGMIFNL